ncbi:major head protein [Bacteriophage DSS3_VP1]|uniref:Main coat protein n=1 Tax=Bacteriophage DSS3_VP1 TaxID=2664196 RepID=A0A7S5KQB1_9CAUD|nr:major head protein [Bacteriophage DSS3_VP1]QGH74598.1 main coat protein [Bacteriophage DSS3_VP1]
MTISTSQFQVIEEVVRQYAHEAYTNSKKLVGTGIVGQRSDVDGDVESYIGQFRWYKPLNPTVNVASATDATDGTLTDISTDKAKYVKTVRTFGGEQVNVAEVITKEDGLKKLARDLAQVQMDDQGEALMAVLKGVAATEVEAGNAAGGGNGGIVDFDTDADAANTGMFVDINADSPVFGSAATGANDARKLFDSNGIGAARGERLFQALGMGFKDHEPNFMYMAASPQTIAELRAANLVDETKVTDGELEFTTVFDGKFRLLPTRQGQMAGGLTAGNLNAQSTKCTFIMKPNAVSFAPVQAPMPVELDRNAAAYRGSGKTQLWYRWGFVFHPEGYTWAGSENEFATNAAYGAAASWTRKVSALNLPILPIFHA